MTLATLAGILLLMMMLRVPIAVAIGLASLAALLLELPPETAAATVAQRLAVSGFSFTLIAIPLFILAGKLMASGGVARRLIDFSRAAVGALPGGLALTNVLANMLFGSVSGSAAAAASGIGGFMIPSMAKEGYPRPYAAALTATAATTGLLIPPSNVMLVYAVVAGGVSISALFVAGYIPGLLLGFGLMGLAMVTAARRGYGERLPFPGWRVFARAALGVLPSAVLLLVVMGGIVSGLFTATESSAVAVVYAGVLALVVYREIGWRDLPRLLAETAATTGMVFFLIGTSVCLAWIFAYADVPGLIASSFSVLIKHPWLLLLAVNLVLLIVGTFMDITPALLIFTPIFLPLALLVAPEMGLTPEAMKYHFGIVLVFNLCLGLVTPPAGTTLFIAAGIAKVSLASMLKPLAPIITVSIVVLLFVTFVPATTLWLPRAFGLLP
ncbi:MAG: TRAP transporter large permease [Silanimonas sp.]